MGDRHLPKVARAVVCLVVAPVVLLALTTGGWGLMGLGGYLVLVAAVIAWDFAALWRAFTNRAPSLRGVLSPRNLPVLAAYCLVFVVWGVLVIHLWGEDRTWYAVGYAVAVAVGAVVVADSAEARRLRNWLILAYNILGTFALMAWAIADSGGDGGAILSSYAQGWGILQTLLFSWGAYFAPILFLPPILVMEPRRSLSATAPPVAGIEGVANPPPTEGSAGDETDDGLRSRGRARRGPVRRIASLGIDAALGATVVLLLLLAAVSGSNIASWDAVTEPSDTTYTERDGFEFVAVGRAFTDRPDPTGSWEDVVAQEIEVAVDLGLDHIRYDLHRELIDDPAHMAKLDVAVESIRAAGLDIMLAPFGSGRWEADHPSFTGLVEEIRRETLLLVERYEPAWVLPFFEPNGQVAINLGRKAPVEEWITVIDALGEEVRNLTQRTQVLVEVAMESDQGLRLVEALSQEGLAIDAIGVDLYPLTADALDDLQRYRDRAVNPELGFWVSEFGVESVLSGQEVQAKALAAAVSSATGELNASGLCVWSLLDDTVLPSNLGLVGRDGTPKEAYRVLKVAIARVRGS